MTAGALGRVAHERVDRAELRVAFTGRPACQRGTPRGPSDTCADSLERDDQPRLHAELEHVLVCRCGRTRLAGRAFAGERVVERRAQGHRGLGSQREDERHLGGRGDSVGRDRLPPGLRETLCRCGRRSR
jgi:hypothetical protein